jgi:hypothetical protein
VRRTRLDDLIILPLGIAAMLRLMRAGVLDDCRTRAQVRMERPASWIGAAFIVAVWLVAATWLLLVLRSLPSPSHDVATSRAKPYPEASENTEGQTCAGAAGLPQISLWD